MKIFPTTISKLLQDQLLAAVDEAMAASLAIYAEDDFGIQLKGDNSPVTRADLEVNRILTEALQKYTPDIPVVSEEANVSYEQRKNFSRFWIIDPIDGTKEFIKRSDEFTINLGLIENGKPTFGIIAIPVTGEVFWGGQTLAAEHSANPSAAFSRNPQTGMHRIKAREIEDATPTGSVIYRIDITCSKDHSHPNDWKFIHNIAKEHYIKLVPCGSTIKICRIAEGGADLYVRMSGINDWDLAAGHAIVEAAGGKVTTPAGRELVYNTESQKLEPFLIHGLTLLDWTSWASWLEEKNDN